MTRIDFYLLPDSSGSSAMNDKLGVACRLAEKAYRLGHTIYLFTPDASTTRALDELLWVFNPGSFLPHATHDDNHTGDDRERVLLGNTSPPSAMHDILISLTPQVAPFFSSFQRLIELVGNETGDKAQSRERFRFYRDRGYDLHTHNL